MKQNNETPLHNAIYSQSKDIIEILISKGANVNAKIYNIDTKSRYEIKGGQTPLHLALKEKIKEIVEILISKGADINATDMNYYKYLKEMK